MVSAASLLSPSSVSAARLLPWLATAAAVVVLGAVAADVWQRYQRWSGVAGTPSSAPVSQPAGPQGGGYRVQDIVAAHLFGSASGPAAPRVTAAPTTRLRLTLYGVVASDDPRHARALIGHSGAPVRAYAIGEQIGGTDAKLHTVEQSRVLLERGGQLESLALPKPELSTRAGPPAPELPTASAPVDPPQRAPRAATTGRVAVQPPGVDEQQPTDVQEPPEDQPAPETAPGGDGTPPEPGQVVYPFQ